MTGGIKSGLLLWNSCVIPSLLKNCSTWMDMKKHDVKRVERVQNLFMNVLLNVYNCPIPLMMLDLDLLKIPLYLLKEKLLLYHHISCLSEKAVARKILEIQKCLQFGGLHEEVLPFLIENEIVEVTEYSKKEWKKLVKKKIKEMNRKSLLEDSEKYKKIDEFSLAIEEEGVKEYFSQLTLEESRLKFRDRASCLRTCKRQFSSERFSNHSKNLKTLFLCENCPPGSEKVDVPSHWHSCPGLEIFKFQRDLSQDSGLLSFYQDIIDYRLSQEE